MENIHQYLWYGYTVILDFKLCFFWGGAPTPPHIWKPLKYTSAMRYQYIFTFRESMYFVKIYILVFVKGDKYRYSSFLIYLKYISFFNKIFNSSSFLSIFRLYGARPWFRSQSLFLVNASSNCSSVVASWI